MPAARFRRLMMIGLLGVSLVSGGGDAAAADPPAPSPASSAPADSAMRRCTDPESRQFDFWIGDWDVHSADGTLAGTNRIESILGGCVLRESWKGAGGMSGTSLNMFDPATRRWHQTWMDDSGTLLLLDGTFADGKMILSGDSPSRRKPGTTVRNRIAWSQLPGGKVRQLWEASVDGGKTWKVAFDGVYTRRL